jgi:hypothetical protein
VRQIYFPFVPCNTPNENVALRIRRRESRDNIPLMVSQVADADIERREISVCPQARAILPRTPTIGASALSPVPDVSDE